MRPFCFIVLTLALITIVAAEPSNVTWISYFPPLKRGFNDGNNKYMQNNLVLRYTAKEQDNDEDIAKRSDHILEERAFSAQPDILHGPVRGRYIGNAFDDLHDIGTSGIKTPKSIKLKCGKYVDSIQIVYRTADGAPLLAGQRGGSSGKSMEFNLNDDERIVKVIGSMRKDVDSLQFYTSKGRVSEQCGNNGDTYFTEQHQGYVLSYISGHAGKTVEQIQFHWVREEVQYIMSSVNYDLNKVKQTTGSLKGTFWTALTNHGPIEQSKSYTKTITVTESDTWTFNTEMKFGVSVTAQAGIPLIGSSKITVSSTFTFGFTYGKTKTLEHSNSYTLTTVVPAKSKIEATLLIFESEIDVPFTTDLTIKYGDGTTVTKKGESGIFKGIQAGRAVAEYGQPIPL